MRVVGRMFGKRVWGGRGRVVIIFYFSPGPTVDAIVESTKERSLGGKYTFCVPGVRRLSNSQGFV